MSQLWMVDHLVRRSMKNAANCVKYGELQGFMKPLLVERILQPWLTGQGYTHLRVVRKSISSLMSDRVLVCPSLPLKFAGFEVASRPLRWMKNGDLNILSCACLVSDLVGNC